MGNRTTMHRRGQLTLPAEVRAALQAEEGDEFEFTVEEPGVMTVRVLRLIPVDQAWFWTAEHQQGERQASEDIAAGRVSKVYKDADDMFADMDAGR